MKCIDCGEDHKWDVWKERCSRCYYRYMRAQRRHKQRCCLACGTSFTTTRNDAKFCSNACRQLTYRRSVTEKHGAVETPRISVTACSIDCGPPHSSPRTPSCRSHNAAPSITCCIAGVRGRPALPVLWEE
jgi:hypothetical protein